jgi:hypothetical protein
MKQLAVEWLVEQFKEYDVEDSSTTYVIEIPSWILKIKELQAKETEQKQKDDFAIGFAEWTHNLRSVCKKDNSEYNKWKNISNKELLEIYKKEKGL